LKGARQPRIQSGPPVKITGGPLSLAAREKLAKPIEIPVFGKLTEAKRYCIITTVAKANKAAAQGNKTSFAGAFASQTGVDISGE
jgi:hypothetical protein